MKKNGFTLIEMMIVVAVIAILISIAVMSVQTVQAKARFSKVKADMDTIGQVAYASFTNSKTYDWPQMTSGKMPADIAALNELRSWPVPPCTGWYYSWEDWTLFPNANSNTVSVTLRNGTNQILYNYCINTFGGGNCLPAGDPLGFGGIPTNISVAPDHHIYCTE